MYIEAVTEFLACVVIVSADPEFKGIPVSIANLLALKKRDRLHHSET
jgi:hypothetical protein